MARISVDKELLELAAFRDFLTELFLRPPEISFFQKDLFSQYSRRFEHNFSKPTDGIVGFGVGLESDEYDPALSVFFNPAVEIRMELLEVLRSFNHKIIPLRGKFFASARPVKSLSDEKLNRGSRL